MFRTYAPAMLLSLTMSMPATAGFIAGPQTFTVGKEVNLQGLEWLPLHYTANLRRSQIESKDGWTDRYGQKWDADDWRYATRQETEALLGSLWDQKYDGWSEGNYAGAYWFLEQFGGLAYDTWEGIKRTDGKHDNLGSYLGKDYSSFMFGNDGDCHFSSTNTCYGEVSVVQHFLNDKSSYNTITKEWEHLALINKHAGWFSDQYGVDMNHNQYNSHGFDSSYETHMGSLLVRSNLPAGQVSAPSSSFLFGLGFLGLVMIRRKLSNHHTLAFLSSAIRQP